MAKPGLSGIGSIYREGTIKVDRSEPTYLFMLYVDLGQVTAFFRGLTVMFYTLRRIMCPRLRKTHISSLIFVRFSSTFLLKLLHRIQTEFGDVFIPLVSDSLL